MSLNGLDATEVNDAYQAALGEGGGWYVFPRSALEKLENLLTSFSEGSYLSI